MAATQGTHRSCSVYGQIGLTAPAGFGVYRPVTSTGKYNCMATYVVTIGTVTYTLTPA